MADPIDFILEDAKGNPHEYTVQPHKSSEGTRLCLRILGMAGEPIGRLVSSNLGDLIELVKGAQTGEGKGLDTRIDLDQIMAQIKTLDLDFAQIVRDLQQSIALAGDEKLFQSLFAHTYRDGNPLAKQAVYESAYVANYMEQFQAAWAVIQANGFLPFFSTS